MTVNSFINILNKNYNTNSEIVDNQLLPLPIAFRVELDRMMNNCKISMNKLNRDNRRKYSSLFYKN